MRPAGAGRGALVHARRRARERRGWAARAARRVGRHAPAALVRWARRDGVGGVCVEHFLLSWRRSCEALRRAGLSVTTGTLNEPALLDRVLPLRPDAVTSDRPHALREAAGARWRPDQPPGRSSVAMMRGCPSIVGVASIVTRANPACAARRSARRRRSPSRRSRRRVDVAGRVHLDPAVAGGAEASTQQPSAGREQPRERAAARAGSRRGAGSRSRGPRRSAHRSAS